MAGATLNWCCFCVHHTTMQQFTVSLYSKPHYAALHVCLAVTCHLHFWQNDWDLLHATAITWGWKRHRNKSQHRRLTLEKKILLSLQWELVTFCSWVLHSAQWAITMGTCDFLFMGPALCPLSYHNGNLWLFVHGSCTLPSELSQLPILYSYVSSLVPNPKEGGMTVWLKEICRFCILILSTVTQQKYFLCASNGLLRVQPLQLVSKQNKRKTNKLLATGADLQYLSLIHISEPTRR